LLVADVLERLDGELLAGVVDEDVEAAKPLDRL